MSTLTEPTTQDSGSDVVGLGIGIAGGCTLLVVGGVLVALIALLYRRKRTSGRATLPILIAMI